MMNKTIKNKGEKSKGKQQQKAKKEEEEAEIRPEKNRHFLIASVCFLCIKLLFAQQN